MVVPRGRPRGRVPPLVIVVCWKWVAADGDERWAGVSDADRAALEIGAAAGRVATTTPCTVVTVGGPGADARPAVALAAGAARAVRVDAPDGLASDAVATAIAGVADGATWVVCGDVSADRGTGSVPAFLAAELDAVQALGLVGVDVRHGVGTDVRGCDRARRASTRRRSPRGARRRGPGRALGRGLGDEAAAGVAPGRARRPHRADRGRDRAPWTRGRQPMSSMPYRPRPGPSPRPAGGARSPPDAPLTDAGGGQGAHTSS